MKPVIIMLLYILLSGLLLFFSMLITTLGHHLLVNVSNLRNSEQIVVDESDYSNPNNPSFIATFD